MASSKSFRWLLAGDCETTGVCIGHHDPIHNDLTGERHQALSWGFMVVEEATLQPVDELYLEIKWNEESKCQREQDDAFGRYAEGIHGMSQEYLEENGIEEEDAVSEIGNLIMKYWGPKTPISMLGHNVPFDQSHLKALMRKYEIGFRFSSRNVDTFSLGLINWRAFDSDELFDITSGGAKRGEHNAMEDIRLTVKAARVTRKIFQRAFDSE